MSQTDPNLPQSMETAEEQVPVSRRVTLRYAAGLGLFVVALLGTTLFLTTTQWFLKHDGYEGMRNLGYSVRAGSPNCELLVYGDSTALTGYDPRLLTELTGMSSCNISEAGPVHGVVGSDLVLQQYLKRNKAPKVILTMWAGNFFSPDLVPGTERTMEGMVYAMEYANRWPTWKMLLRKGSWVPWFSTVAVHSMGSDILSHFDRRKDNFDARAFRDSHLGLYQYPLPPETACVRAAAENEPSKVKRYEASVVTFRRKYETPETKVLINVAAVPTCDPLYPYELERLKGLHDNQLEQLPIGDFNQNDEHFSPEGTEYVTRQAAKQVMALLHGSGVPAQ